jgi:trans-aconitate 2-methyltransferase
MPPREWNAASYDRVGTAMTELGLAVLDRLELAGEEVVLDAGCGTGAITEEIVRRVPDGRVIAVDGSREMARLARERLGAGVEVIVADLLELELAEQVDVVFSTATFHWIEDHARLFARLRSLLAPGGRLMAQCGGEGNIRALLAVASSLAAEPPYKQLLNGRISATHFAGVAETERLLAAAGFAAPRCWLADAPVRPQHPREYLRTIVLGPAVQSLGPELGERYLDDVLAALPRPVTVDYVRLNIEAVLDGV